MCNKLLGKSPLRHKMVKNNVDSRVRWGSADKISLFKAFLHNCGHADILSKQLKKVKHNKRIYATFSKSQKTHGVI